MIKSNMYSKKKKIVFLSAGGTGGHMFPAEALGQELIGRKYAVHLITDKRGANLSGALQNIPIHTVPSSTFKSGVFNLIRTFFLLFMGILKSMYLIVRYRPVGIIGFGGYPSFPVMKAAQLLRVPNMIHDQNGILGKANQYLAKKTKIIATSLPNTAGIRAEDQKKVVFTGNPVRPSILHARFTDYQQPENDKPFRLFVVGGSQGAKIFSKVVPKALARLPVQLRRRLVVTQQCRPDDCLETKNFYQENKIEAVIQPFFKDIADILIKSHLVISRSGASSVSEIATIGRPAIFIPFSHADEQQIINANVLVERQAAWMIVESGFNEEILSSQLETLMQLPDKLKEAADKAKSCAKPTAAKDLADVVQRLIEE